MTSKHTILQLTLACKQCRRDTIVTLCAMSPQEIQILAKYFISVDRYLCKTRCRTPHLVSPRQQAGIAWSDLCRPVAALPQLCKRGSDSVETSSIEGRSDLPSLSATCRHFLKRIVQFSIKQCLDRLCRFAERHHQTNDAASSNCRFLRCITTLMPRCNFERDDVRPSQDCGRANFKTKTSRRTWRREICGDAAGPS